MTSSRFARLRTGLSVVAAFAAASLILALELSR